MTRIDKWSILAGVRFILASIVAINHLSDYTDVGWLPFVSQHVTFEAILGFLLISGYSISVSYAKQPQGFMLRRLYRLYPVYLAAIVTNYISFRLLKVPPPDLYALIVNALFLNQILTSSSFVGPAWTLSLEFWLYCLAPWLMRLAMGKVRLIIWGSFASFVVYTVLRTLCHLPYYSGVAFGGNLLFLAFIWVAGLGLARAKGHEAVAMRDIRLIFCAYVALLAAIQLGFRLKHHDLASFLREDILGYVLCGATLAFVYYVFKILVVPERPGVHRSRFLRWVGDVSYPLYVLHAAAYGILCEYFKIKNPFVVFAATLAFSAAVYWSLDFYSRRRHQQIGTT